MMSCACCARVLCNGPWKVFENCGNNANLIRTGMHPSGSASHQVPLLPSQPTCPKRGTNGNNLVVVPILCHSYLRFQRTAISTHGDSSGPEIMRRHVSQKPVTCPNQSLARTNGSDPPPSWHAVGRGLQRGCRFSGESC